MKFSSRQFSFEFFLCGVVRRKDPNCQEKLWAHKRREDPKIPLFGGGGLISFCAISVQLSCNCRATIVQLSMQQPCNHASAFREHFGKFCEFPWTMVSPKMKSEFVCTPDVYDKFFLDCDLVWSLSLVCFFLLAVTPSQS